MGWKLKTCLHKWASRICALPFPLHNVISAISRRHPFPSSLHAIFVLSHTDLCSCLAGKCFVFKRGVDEGMEVEEWGRLIFSTCAWNLNVVLVEKAAQESTRKVGPHTLNMAMATLHGQQKPRNLNSWFYWHINDPSPYNGSISSRFLSMHQEKYVPLLPGQTCWNCKEPYLFHPEEILPALQAFSEL